MFPKCMIGWVVVDSLVMGVVYDDIYHCLLGSCVKFSLTEVVVMKNSVRN